MADSPHIHRPIPRRPFDLDRMEPTPPPDGDSPAPGTSSYQPSILHTPLRSSGPGLSPSSTFTSEGGGNDTDTTLSRAASFLNLQRSTLFGIYQNASQPSSPTPDDNIVGGNGTGTGSPWGTGAETPLVRRPGVSDAMFEIMRSRRSGDASGRLHELSADRPEEGGPRQPVRDAVTVAFRVAVLFGLGVGYGILVGRLRSDAFSNGSGVGSTTTSRKESAGGWQHSLFWGVGGVVIAALLPWFDSVWEARFGGRFDAARPKSRRKSEDERRPPTDWSLVLRAITAFLGIVFAIVSVLFLFPFSCVSRQHLTT